MSSRWLLRFGMDLADLSSLTSSQTNIITACAKRVQCADPNFIDKKACGIHDTSFQSYMKCDVYTCKDNVVSSGGTTVFQRIVEHMTEERTDPFHDELFIAATI